MREHERGGEEEDKRDERRAPQAAGQDEQPAPL
jgi:hypothetical protein